MGWKKALSLLTLIVVTILSGCGFAPNYTPRASPDWSRGKPIGFASLSDQVAMQLEETGGIYLAWVGLGRQIEFAKLDETAQVIAKKALDIFEKTPRRPQLLVGPRRTLHLVWQEKGEEVKGIYYAQLDSEGEVIVEPFLLSLPERNAERYRIILNQEGGIEVFWSDDSFSISGIYHLSLNYQGEVSSPNSLIVPEGINPSPKMDKNGLIHLAWFQRSIPGEIDVYYSTFDTTSRALEEGRMVASFPIQPIWVVKGPVMGIDEEEVYIFWVVMRKAWRRIVSHIYYVNFPLGQPFYQDFKEVKIPGSGDLKYEPATGEYNYHFLAPVEGAYTHFIGAPYAIEGQAKELLLVFHMLVTTKWDENLQIVMVVFDEGEPKGYQIITKTKTASLSPNIVAESRGDLHLTWLDTVGFGKLSVLYASTSPEVKARLNPLTAADLIEGGLSLAMGFLSVLTFVPVLIIWTFLPTLWLLLFYLFTDESGLKTRRAWLALGLAIFLLLLSKIIAFPTLLNYIPFLHLLPPRIAPPLTRWIIPSLITTISVGIMFGYLKWGKSESLFSAYFVFALADGLLSLLLYIPTLVGKV